MFDQILPETQTIIQTVGTGFGFIVLITAVGEVIYHGAYESIVRWFRE